LLIQEFVPTRSGWNKLEFSGRSPGISSIRPTLFISGERNGKMAEPHASILSQLVFPVLTALCGALSAFVIAQYQSSKTGKKERLAKQAEIQFAYLDPLRVAAENFAWKLYTIEEKIREHRDGTGGLGWMLKTFHCVKEPDAILGRSPSYAEYGKWCNGEGFFAVSTIYAAAIYFLHARRTRRECAKSIELIQKLDGVRLSLGHEFGIYVMLQDSRGEYGGDPLGMEIGYRQFCGKLFNEEERLWFQNMLDYYREIDKKSVDQRRGIMSALHDLLSYLQTATGNRVNDPFSRGLPQANDVVR
jgi:hypothetical protein